MYQQQVIAVVGVSQDASKYGYKIFTALRDFGMKVYGINPKGGQVNGQVIYAAMDQLPVPPEVAVLVIPPVALDAAVAQCIACGVKEIWFQPGARSEAAFQKAQAAGIKAVNGCFMADNGFW